MKHKFKSLVLKGYWVIKLYLYIFSKLGPIRNPRTKGAERRESMFVCFHLDWCLHRFYVWIQTLSARAFPLRENLDTLWPAQVQTLFLEEKESRDLQWVWRKKIWQVTFKKIKIYIKVVDYFAGSTGAAWCPRSQGLSRSSRPVRSTRISCKGSTQTNWCCCVQ